MAAALLGLTAAAQLRVMKHLSEGSLLQLRCCVEFIYMVTLTKMWHA